MYTEAQKLHLIEYLLNEQNEQVLNKVEHLLKVSSSDKTGNGPGFKNFKPLLTPGEVAEMEKAIQEGCEQIDESDWK